jgi:hypothetical protein
MAFPVSRWAASPWPSPWVDPVMPSTRNSLTLVGPGSTLRTMQYDESWSRSVPGPQGLAVHRSGGDGPLEHRPARYKALLGPAGAPGAPPHPAGGDERLIGQQARNDGTAGLPQIDRSAGLIRVQVVRCSSPANLRRRDPRGMSGGSAVVSGGGSGVYYGVSISCSKRWDTRGTATIFASTLWTPLGRPFAA